MTTLSSSKIILEHYAGEIGGEGGWNRVNNEDLLPTVQVGDDEGWNSASDPVQEEEGADSKDFQKIDSTVLGEFFFFWL